MTTYPVLVTLTPTVRTMLSGTELFQNPERETDDAAHELRRAVLSTGPRSPVRLSLAAAGHLFDYVDVWLYAATDDGTSHERATARRLLGVLVEQGVS